VVRFRNAVKETRDVGFIFLHMGVGMAAVRGSTTRPSWRPSPSAGHLPMQLLNWFHLDVQRPDRQGAGSRRRGPHPGDHRRPHPATPPIRTGQYGDHPGWALTELLYTVRLRKGVNPPPWCPRCAVHQRPTGHRPERLRPHRPVTGDRQSERWDGRVPRWPVGGVPQPCAGNSPGRPPLYVRLRRWIPSPQRQN
jgi:hypothetical protein